MRNPLSSGLLAGLAASVPLGLLLTAIVASDARLSNDTLMQLLARGLGTTHVALAWIVTLGFGALGGVVFGALARHGAPEVVARVALLSAVVLWALVATVAVPLLVGGRPLVGLSEARTWPLVVGSLMLNLAFWSVLAAVFVSLRRRRVGGVAVTASELRRAA